MNPSSYRPAIDGLRAVAVLSVLIFHLHNSWLPGGFVGVDIFFVISGYLITGVLLREYQHDGFRLSRFYQRRIARLLPAFFAVALATMLLAALVYSSQDLASAGANFAAAAASVENLKLMQQGSYFVLSPDAQPFLHYWSLSVEEQFYLLFPLALWLLVLRTNRHRTAVLTALCGVSLILCIQLTAIRPTLAFFLLPTRAWELLAGSILASVSQEKLALNRKLWASLSVIGFATIAISLFTIDSRMMFPGYVAMFPVLGTVCLIGADSVSSDVCDGLLSWKPMVIIGQMSYSLYLLHWPIFSFVDYTFYLGSPSARIALKVFIVLVTLPLCYFLIESPGRRVLNDPRRRLTAFAAFAMILVVCIPLGILVRRANYIDAEIADVGKGGVRFNQAGKNGSLLLIGDSNGSMYGKMAKEIAAKLGLRLSVASVAAEDPLPSLSRKQSQLWLDSSALASRESPDVLLLVCQWRGKLQDSGDRLEIAVNELKTHVATLILITQPPEMPERANRGSLRDGARPPFFEDPSIRTARMNANALVKSLEGDNVVVVDIEDLFTAKDGSIIFTNNIGQYLYHDGKHLSGMGAELVKPAVIRVITGRMPRVFPVLAEQ